MGSLDIMLPTQIMMYWVRQDAAAAENWVFNGPVSEEKRDNWIRAYVSTLVHEDPRRALSFSL